MKDLAKRAVVVADCVEGSQRRGLSRGVFVDRTFDGHVRLSKESLSKAPQKVQDQSNSIAALVRHFKTFFSSSESNSALQYFPHTQQRARAKKCGGMTE